MVDVLELYGSPSDSPSPLLAVGPSKPRLWNFLKVLYACSPSFSFFPLTTQA